MINKSIITSLLLSMSLLPTQAQDFKESVYSRESTTFTLLAPDDSHPKLRIYKEGEGGKAIKTVKMKRVGTDSFSVTVKGDLQGKFYTFDVGKGECPGVFAKAVGINGKRAAVIDMKKTNPTGWEDDNFIYTKNPCDLIIYEMHHRDYSIDKSANIKDGGKYLALTHHNALQHLKDLGINAVHFQPSFDFASVDESRLDEPQFNWGYDPVNYNVPEGSYSTDPYKPDVRIYEFKKMVQSLHDAGIRVIMDVVLNHTMDVENSNFERTYPGYFYRLKKDGTLANGSGCGNETASEKAYMRQYMIESFKYWASEYHIDCFRVDLMGIHDIETMNAIQKAVKEINPSAFIYGEGWAAESPQPPENQLAMKVNVNKLDGIAAFSDEMRDALRGPFSDDKKTAFLGGLPGNEESIKFGIAGAVKHPQVDVKKVNYTQAFWAKQPYQMISYVSCHDDMCLVDRLKASIPGITTDELIRLDLLAQTAVFTSQGVPFMLSGAIPDFADAFFESVSGFSTTGATILSEVESLPHCINLWRLQTHWLGGMGIIILFIAVLPQFAVAGRQMFFAEAPGPTEDKLTPRIKNTATALWGLYIVLTIIQIILLVCFKMPLFDAICNSFSTISSGGFSPNPQSIMGYNSLPVMWIVIIFMLLSGCNLALIYKVFTKFKYNLIWTNEEFKTYIKIIVIVSLLVFGILFVNTHHHTFEQFTNSVFTVLSIMTSTGFYSCEYSMWSVSAQILLFIVILFSLIYLRVSSPLIFMAALIPAIKP